MDKYVEAHTVSCWITESGEQQLRHTRMDGSTRRFISENLVIPEPVDSGRWTWEEILLFGVSEMLLRREEQQLRLF